MEGNPQVCWCECGKRFQRDEDHERFDPDWTPADIDCRCCDKQECPEHYPENLPQ